MATPDDNLSIDHSDQETFVNGNINSTAPEGPPNDGEFDDEDFGDFRSTSTSEPSTKAVITTAFDKTVDSATTPRVTSLDGYNKLLRAIFEPDEAPPEDVGHPRNAAIDKELCENSPHITSWAHIQNFEESHCLLFKWMNSNVHQRLLTCLNITKASVIMYSTKWGVVEVPKFASSLLDTPLQPAPITQSVTSPLPPESEFDSFQSHREHESDTGAGKCDTSTTTNLQP